jgi:hypothetical protein
MVGRIKVSGLVFSEEPMGVNYYYYYYSSISACSPRAGTNNIHICAPLIGKQKRGGDCRKTNR